MAEQETCITFTGGLGAQLISAAAYFYLENQGRPVSAYTGYFDQVPVEAVPGTGQISVWAWELSHYGFSRADFRTPSSASAELVWDGKKKASLGFQGLSNNQVRDRFPIAPEVIAYRQSLFRDEPYICLHIRRGDYLNVATYVLSDSALFRALCRVSKLAPNLLIVSDSPLSPEMVSLLQTLPLNMIVAIGGDPMSVHGLMRLSTILICSNSQYSMTAAALRDSYSLTLYPAQHDGDLNSEANAYLKEIREFQLITQFV